MSEAKKLKEFKSVEMERSERRMWEEMVEIGVVSDCAWIKWESFESVKMEREFKKLILCFWKRWALKKEKKYGNLKKLMECNGRIVWFKKKKEVECCCIC